MTRCTSIIVAVAAAGLFGCAQPAQKAASRAENAAPPVAGPEKEMLGITIVADVSLSRIDQFRTLGMAGGFGENQPLCDFIATEKWISKRGSSIQKGETIHIGKATVVEATDGFGNTGTKLILDSAEPKEGLVFYCYAFNRAEKAYWAIDRRQIEQALTGYFHIEE
jgi:hypothetical protein